MKKENEKQTVTKQLMKLEKKIWGVGWGWGCMYIIHSYVPFYAHVCKCVLVYVDVSNIIFKLDILRQQISYLIKFLKKKRSTIHTIIKLDCMDLVQIWSNSFQKLITIDYLLYHLFEETCTPITLHSLVCSTVGLLSCRKG